MPVLSKMPRNHDSGNRTQQRLCIIQQIPRLFCVKTQAAVFLHFFLGLWFFVACQKQDSHPPQNGVYQVHYPTGEIHSKISYKNGKKQGWAESYNRAGKVLHRARFNQGKLKEEVFLDATGQVVKKLTYLTQNRYYPGEIKQPQEAYQIIVQELSPSRSRPLERKSFRHGLYQSWYVGGQLAQQAQYQWGQLHGSFARFLEKGTPLERGEYIQGKKQGSWQEWDSTGAPRALTNYLQDKKFGPQKFWHPTGTLSADAQYVDDKKDGIARMYYPGGQLRWEGSFVQGKKQGIFRYFWEEGPLWIIAHYANDTLDGKWEWWTSKGEPISQRIYEKGQIVSDTRLQMLREEIFPQAPVSVPVEYMGFYWGMTPPEALAQSQFLEARLLKQTPEQLELSRESDQGDELITLEFNEYDELWSLALTFMPKGQVNYSSVALALEKKWNKNWSTPTISPGWGGLPRSRSQWISWGELRPTRTGTQTLPNSQNKQKRTPPSRHVHAALIAELTSFEDKSWVTLNFRNEMLGKFDLQNPEKSYSVIWNENP